MLSRGEFMHRSYFFSDRFDKGIINWLFSCSTFGPLDSAPLLTDGLQNKSIIQRAFVFWQNSKTLGLSLVPPHWRWQPKNCSMGSWQTLLLRNARWLSFTSWSGVDGKSPREAVKIQSVLQVARASGCLLVVLLLLKKCGAWTKIGGNRPTPGKLTIYLYLLHECQPIGCRCRYMMLEATKPRMV